MTDAGNAAAGSQGQNQAHGEQGAVTPAQLDQFRSTLLNEVNSAITGHIRRLDIGSQIKAALEELGPTKPEQKAQGAAKSASDQSPELAELKKQLEATHQALARERKSQAIRAALSAKGLTGTALEDAAEALSRRDDITSEQDPTGRHVWRGRVSSDLGPVEKPLDEVVSGFLSERPYLQPAPHRGGVGARGGVGGGAGGGTQPGSLADMTAEDIQANPGLARQLARQARSQSATSPWGQ